MTHVLKEDEALLAADEMGLLIMEAASLVGYSMFVFLTKEYIHAIPRRQPWLHGAHLQIN